jgi:hypothetical protein
LYGHVATPAATIVHRADEDADARGAVPARISDFVALAWHDTSEHWRYVLATSIVFAIVIQVVVLLAYYHSWNGVNWDDARVQVDDAHAARQMWDLSVPQWWWTIRAAIATADFRAAILIPVTLVFGYVAFRAGLARPTASVAHQKVA